MIDFVAAVYRLPRKWAELLVVLLTIIIGAIDLMTGYEISMSFFYLIPITFATWFISRSAGILVAVMGMAVWALAEELAREHQISVFILSWNAVVRFGFFIVTVMLLAKLRTVLEREREQARVDYLTGMVNSRGLYELAQLELDRMARYQRAFTVAYVDMDNFKSINDTFGHKKGDEVLRLAARFMKNSVRSVDIVARMGGDEFVLVLSEMDFNKAHEVLQRIHTQLHQEMRKNNIAVSFSVGATTYIKPPGSVDEMIKRADALMYQAKNDGKNMIRHKVFDG